MPSSMPAPLSAVNMEELKDQLSFIIQDIYSKIDYALNLDGKGVMSELPYGGLGRDLSSVSAILGAVGGESIDVVALNSSGGLTDATTLNASTAAHGFLKKLSGTATEFMGGDGNWNALPASAQIPIGMIVELTVATAPADLFGYGTWAAVEGVFTVGYKSGDADFGTPGGTGGAKTHSQAITPANYYTNTPSSTTEVQSGTGATVAASNHIHLQSNPPINDGSSLPPYKTVYKWERTA